MCKFCICVIGVVVIEDEYCVMYLKVLFFCNFVLCGDVDEVVLGDVEKL